MSIHGKLFLLLTEFQQLSQDQITREFKEFTKSHLLFIQKSHFGENFDTYGVKKEKCIQISYGNENVVIFDNFQQYTPKTTLEDEMYRVSTAETNPNCRSIEGVFMDLHTFFSRIDIMTHS